MFDVTDSFQCLDAVNGWVSTRVRDTRFREKVILEQFVSFLFKLNKSVKQVTLVFYRVILTRNRKIYIPFMLLWSTHTYYHAIIDHYNCASLIFNFIVFFKCVYFLYTLVELIIALARDFMELWKYYLLPEQTILEYIIMCSSYNTSASPRF